jgi:hypothetical protein
MKIKSLLFAMAVALCGNMNATVLWEGTHELNWGSDGWFTIDASEFSDVKSGDAIKLTYTLDETQGYWQFKLQSGDWQPLSYNADIDPQYGCANMTAGSTEFSQELNDADAQKLAELGLVVAGVNLTVNKVELVSGSGEEKDPSIIWEGSNEFGNWASWQVLPLSKFKNATAGEKLRLSFTDVLDGAMVHLCQATSSEWIDMPDATSYDGITADQDHFDYTITENMLSVFSGETGALSVIVQGCNLTLTKAQLIEDGAGVSAINDANAAKFVVNGRTISYTGNDAISVYNLQGAKVAASAKSVEVAAGLYIVKAGANTAKLLVK